MKKLSILAAAACCVAGMASTTLAQTYNENFDDPFGDWTTRWFYQNSNAGNYYVATGNCDESNRGNNSCGLWIVDTQTCGAGVGGTTCDIILDPGFGANISSFAWDHTGFVDHRITVFDMSGNIVLDVPSAVLTRDQCNGHRYTANSANGISRILMDSSGHSGGQIEGNTAWDNIEVIRSSAGDVTVNGANIRNDFGEFDNQWLMAHATDQSGLDANYVSGSTDFGAFTSSTLVGSSSPSTTWFGVSGAPLPGNIDFDLGATWNVTRVAMWSFTDNDINVLDGFEVYVDDNPAFTSPTFAGTFTFLGGTGTGAAQVFDSTDVVGRYVRLRLTTQDTSLVGMGEFVFGGLPVGGFTLDVSGRCPGLVTVNWDGAQPNATVALIFAKNTGSFVIPFGPCQGTVLGLGNQGIRLVNTFPSGLNGSGSRRGNAGSAACGGYLQMHDIPACTLSNVAQLP